MKMLTLSKRDSFVWVVAGLLATALMQDADACTACMGDSTGPIGEAANGAIFVMLGVLALVLGQCGRRHTELVRTQGLAHRVGLTISPHDGNAIEPQGQRHGSLSG